MRARQCVGIVGAQPSVGPIAALSVAARIAKQRFDLLDPPPIPARLWRQRGAFRRRKTVEPLARLECGVLRLDIAPITCRSLRNNSSARAMLARSSSGRGAR